MQSKRRGFLKVALGSTAVAIGGITTIANAKDEKEVSNGVVVGKALKKEVLYKKTTNWNAYYKVAY